MDDYKEIRSFDGRVVLESSTLDLKEISEEHLLTIVFA